MLKKVIYSTGVLLLLGMAYWYYFIQEPPPFYKRHPKDYGLVGDKETALKIAEAVWLPVYGKRIYRNKPFNVELKDSVWIVTGTLHADFGGTPYIEIHRKDCRIIKMSHGK